MAAITQVSNVVQEAAGTLSASVHTAKISNVVQEVSGTLKTTGPISKYFNVVRETVGSITAAPAPTYLVACVNMGNVV